MNQIFLEKKPHGVKKLKGTFMSGWSTFENLKILVQEGIRTHLLLLHSSNS